MAADGETGARSWGFRHEASRSCRKIRKFPTSCLHDASPECGKLRRIVVLERNTFADAEDVGDLPVGESSLHELLDPGMVTDVAADRFELMLSLLRNVGFILPTLMECTDQSLMRRVTALVVDVTAERQRFLRMRGVVLLDVLPDDTE
jgi:hypothetical protein